MEWIICMRFKREPWDRKMYENHIEMNEKVLICPYRTISLWLGKDEWPTPQKRKVKISLCFGGMLLCVEYVFHLFDKYFCVFTNMPYTNA